MLKGIPKILSPELLKILSEMGHGDEIVIADANFPAASLAQRLVRAEGTGGTEMLAAVLQLLPLDQYDREHFILMEKCPGDPADVAIWQDYTREVQKYEPQTEAAHLERFAFYERAKKAFAVVITGERRQYANILLKKGCVFDEA